MTRRKVIKTEVRRENYWQTVMLGLRFIGGTASLPIFVVGLVIRAIRRIGDKIRGR